MRPAVPDPPEISPELWQGFTGEYGWDVGANCGQSVAAMCQVVTRFTCFEPSPDSYGFLREALPWVDARQVALSDHDGELVLAAPGGEQAETGQLVTIGTPGMEWSPPDWSQVPRVTVPCRTADSLAHELGLPEFVKIDTEGHEAQVLAGALELLETGMTSFLIEFHSEANSLWCQGELADAGYTVELVRHPHYEPGSALWLGHGWLKAHPGGGS